MARPAPTPTTIALAALCAAACAATAPVAEAGLVSAGAAYALAAGDGPWRLEVEDAAPNLGPGFGAAAWWQDSVGALVSARVLDSAAESGPRALLADTCAAWRLARTAGGSVDLYGGARTAAASDSVGAAGGVDFGAYRGESQLIVGVRARQELLRGVVASARADVSPSAAGAPSGWTVGGGVQVELDRAWRLSVEASVRSLDQSLSDALGSASPAAGGTEGAFWIGLSKSF